MVGMQTAELQLGPRRQKIYQAWARESIAAYAYSKGGKPGQWSARKAQMVAAEYKEKAAVTKAVSLPSKSP